MTKRNLLFSPPSYFTKKNCATPHEQTAKKPVVLIEFGKNSIWLAQIESNFVQGYRKDKNTAG